MARGSQVPTSRGSPREMHLGPFLLVRAISDDADGSIHFARSADGVDVRLQLLAATGSLDALDGVIDVAKRLGAAVLDRGIEPETGRIWIATPWVDAEPVGRRDEWSTAEDFAAFVRPIATLLDGLRAAGHQHGRLDPTRVVRAADGRPHVLDVAASAWLSATTGPRVSDREAFADLMDRMSRLAGVWTSLRDSLRSGTIPTFVDAVDVMPALSVPFDPGSDYIEPDPLEPVPPPLWEGLAAPRDDSGWVALFDRIRADRPPPFAISNGALTSDGIAWSLPSDLDIEQAWRIAHKLFTALGALDGTKSQLILDRVLRTLDLPHSQHRDRGYDVDLSAGLDIERDDLAFGHLVWGWPHPHEPGWVSSSVGRIAIRRLPWHVARAAEVIRTLLDVAGSAAYAPTLRPSADCRFCGRHCNSWELHDDSCCHPCAEAHLGVVH